MNHKTRNVKKLRNKKTRNVKKIIDKKTRNVKKVRNNKTRNVKKIIDNKTRNVKKIKNNKTRNVKKLRYKKSRGRGLQLIINPRYNSDDPNSQPLITEDEKKRGDEAEETKKSLLARFNPNSEYIRGLSARLNEVNPEGLSTEQIEDVQRAHNFLNKSDAVRYIRAQHRSRDRA
tara:strand:+ start:169 stop:690 length:522 start_codon:yes stop_codon:yes gene_type:complete